MEKKIFRFSRQATTCYFDASFSQLKDLADQSKSVVVTDENVYGVHARKFRGWKCVVVKAGEANKVQATADDVIGQLIDLKVDRSFTIVGVGGGVVTDLAGYVASIYMRGLKFGFVPTSILAMVDASIGGKNGVDVGVYKNLVGTINQPAFLLYDTALLKSLSDEEWVNGFAEIIKHACIRDARLFAELERNTLKSIRRNLPALSKLIRRNVVIKCDIVKADEFEKAERRLLNFGHTWGHAIETRHQLPHGHAVSIGMVMACRLSEYLTGFSQTERIIRVLEQYGLPVQLDVNRKEVFDVLRMDKKKTAGAMNYVLLNRIGHAAVRSIPIDELAELIYKI